MEDVFGNKVEMAPDINIYGYPELLGELLRAIAIPMHWKDIDHVWVSDLSSISDFFLEDDDVQKIAEKLGVEVGQGDLLVDIIGRMLRRTAN